MLAFESLEKAQAAFASPAFLDAAKMGEQDAKSRLYAVEGVPLLITAKPIAGKA